MAANPVMEYSAWSGLFETDQKDKDKTSNNNNNNNEENGQTEKNRTSNNQKAINPARISSQVPVSQMTAVYDDMTGFLKSTHWSKPYYSALVHNNPQLPYHLLEHVNCTYLSTPGRAPTLLALKQHVQSLAVLISLLAPAQFGGTLEPPNEGKINGDAPFAADQAFDWLNNLQVHYSTEDSAHKKPLYALTNLVKGNSDTGGPKWHCPLDTTGVQFPEDHPFQQYRPFESHMTLLMHANEILERLDHEYSAMGGILGVIPLDSDNVEEQGALSQAKTTLIGQWILYTQHLVVRMHELEIAYGNSLDLLANEAIVPMQHNSIHGPDGRSGREIVFPQDRWILANAGEDVFTFIHRSLDQAEAHQDAQDDVFAEQKVLGDAAYTSNDELKYRGIVKVDLNTRFYRLRGSGHGPLFVLPAFGDRAGTKHTRDIENRPTVIAIPQPSTKEAVSSWESKHKDVDDKLLRLGLEKSNLEARVSQLQSSVEIRDREIQRLGEIQKQYDDKINKADKDFAKEVVRLGENARYFQKLIRDGEERQKALEQEVANFKKANLGVQGESDPVTPLVEKINEQQDQIRKLQKDIKEQEKKAEDLARDNDTLRMLSTSPFKNPAPGNPVQVEQLRSQLSSAQLDRQMLLQEIDNLRKAKVVKGKILNLSQGFKLDYGSTFEDSDLGITACSTQFYKALLEAESERNDHQQKLDDSILGRHNIQVLLDRSTAENERLRKENEELRNKDNSSKPSKIINIPWALQYTSTFRDDNQGLIVLTTDWYDHLVTAEKSAGDYISEIASLQKQINEFKTPADMDLSGIYEVVKEQMGQAESYRDTNRNIAVLTLSHFDELQKADIAKSAMEKQLDGSHKSVQALNQQLEQARTQLSGHLKGEREAEIQLVDLQVQLEDIQQQLRRSLEDRQQLEKQLSNLTIGTSESDLLSQVSDLHKQLSHSTKAADENTTDMAELRTRYEQLRLNETNLRGEVASLRQQLSRSNGSGNSSSTKKSMPKRTARGKAPATTTITRGAAADDKERPAGEESDELPSVREELDLYKRELEITQTIWNDLQTRHLELQGDLDKARRDCEGEKAALWAELDAARDQRDELRKRVQELEQQPEKLEG